MCSIEQMSQAFARPATQRKSEEVQVAIPEQCLAELQTMNQWMSSEEEAKYKNWEVTMEGPGDKEQRKRLHETIKTRFPFLMTSTQRVDETFMVSVKPDLVFVELKPMLSLEDLTVLYEFRNTSVEPNAQAIIGRGLEREVRTEVFRKMTAADKSLDSKTIDDPV